MNSLQSWLATLAVAVDDRRRWDRWPTPLALALILGIRAAMREHNLYGTDDEASTPKLDPEPRAAGARGADRRRLLQRPRRPRRWAWPARGSAATCRCGSPSPSGTTG